MTKCAMKECKNNSSIQLKQHGVTYHRFPHNEVLREKWRYLISRNRKEEYYKPNYCSVVCSKHFSEDDIYFTKKGISRLKKTAIPNIQLPQVEDDDSPAPPISPILKKEFILDLETPVITLLKRKLKKAAKRNRRLTLDNRNLYDRNIRLLKTCKSLKETLMRLKKRL